ncbi:hypothetical protein SME46J_50260 (plasmid) [Serratia marcescens]|nr:hypothetical protein SME46J_50260 [Serratia marcescens]
MENEYSVFAKDYVLPHYQEITTRVEALIPDYGLHMDSQILHRRGKEIKKIFPAVTNGAKVIHIRRLKLDPGVNLLS